MNEAELYAHLDKRKEHLDQQIGRLEVVNKVFSWALRHRASLPDAPREELVVLLEAYHDADMVD